MIRSLSRPSLLCSTARNLCHCHLSNRPFLTVRSKSPSIGIRGFKVRFRSAFLNLRSMSSQNEVLQISKLLTATNDHYGGVIVEMTTEPVDSAVFVSLLRASVSHWRQQEGFYFHHAEPKYLMLVYWIPETANSLPVNATHRVGIGAFVMNEEKEVLVVQEKSGMLRGTGVWKFPTGVVDEGEDICDAAVREVKEETGIDAKFVEILAFRQSHEAFFEKSDLFFVCLLQPLSFDIQKQESEIEAAEWMPFREYAAQPFVQKHDLFKHIVDICLAKRDGKYSGFSPVPTKAISSDKNSYLYLNRQCLNNQ
ncbi:nudix hydrolase 2 isoform X2 [Camellia sinensis]|uniref:nudix hydrolase 2 isoform X2 n=1 Tax=Camellia sinensis TaxID=4442 RepID=UPI001035B9A7|nr:nudix hydrolase 2 isoform X2 [Camellia sinensis]